MNTLAPDIYIVGDSPIDIVAANAAIYKINIIYPSFILSKANIISTATNNITINIPRDIYSNIVYFC